MMAMIMAEAVTTGVWAVMVMIVVAVAGAMYDPEPIPYMDSKI